MATSDQLAELDEAARCYAKENLNETEENRTNCLAELKEWLEENPNINACREDRVLLSFLRGSKFRMDRAKIKIANFYVARAEIPAWFANRDPDLPEVKELLKLGVFVPLRKFHENRLVVVIRTAAHAPKVHRQDDVLKVGLMALDAAAKDSLNAQIYGVSAIFDMKGISLGHARQLTPSIIKKAVHVWQNYHCRPKQLEFINAPLYINVVLNIFKGFMSEKLKGRVRVHFGGLGSLHDVIDKSVLPAEYGGDDGHMQDHIENWKNKLSDYKEWFAYDEQFKTTIVT